MALFAVEGSDAVDGGGVEAVVFQYLVIAFQGFGLVAAHAVGVGEGGVETNVAGVASESLFEQLYGHVLAVADAVEGAEVVIGVGHRAVELYGFFEMAHGFGMVAFSVLDVAHDIFALCGLGVGFEGAVGPGDGVNMVVALGLDVGHHGHGQ